MIFVRTLFDQLPYPKSNLFALFCTANLIRFGSLAFTFTFTKSYSFFCPLINSCFLLQFFSAVFVYILCLLLYILVYGNVWLGFVFSFENISNFLLNISFFFFNIQVQSVLSAVGSIRNLNWFLLQANVSSS